MSYRLTNAATGAEVATADLPTCIKALEHLTAIFGAGSFRVSPKEES